MDVPVTNTLVAAILSITESSSTKNHTKRHTHTNFPVRLNYLSSRGRFFLLPSDNSECDNATPGSLLLPNHPAKEEEVDKSLGRRLDCLSQRLIDFVFPPRSPPPRSREPTTKCLHCVLSLGDNLSGRGAPRLGAVLGHTQKNIQGSFEYLMDCNLLIESGLSASCVVVVGLATQV